MSARRYDCTDHRPIGYEVLCFFLGIREHRARIPRRLSSDSGRINKYKGAVLVSFVAEVAVTNAAIAVTGNQHRCFVGRAFTRGGSSGGRVSDPSRMQILSQTLPQATAAAAAASDELSQAAKTNCR